MLRLQIANGELAAAFVVLALCVVFLVAVAAAGGLRSSRRRQFHIVRPFGTPYQNQGLDLVDPAQQLNAVMAASFSKQRVLSRSEYRVFKIIEDEVAIAGKGHRVFAQTSLGEILKSSDGNAFHSINSKRADILVIDRGGWPVLAVEYQGEGHYQGAAAARDAVKKEALRKAGVQHIEFHPADGDDEIRSRVRGQLGCKPASPADRSLRPQPPPSPPPASASASP